MPTTYSYLISSDFSSASQVVLSDLQTAIVNNATVSVDPDYLNQEGDADPTVLSYKK